MAFIRTETFVNASPQLCFDLSRSIDLHLHTSAKTKEEAVGGRTSGLISEGEFVSWRAKHFGIWMNLTIRIKEMKPHFYFRDEQEKGAFRYFIHEHFFESSGSGTLIKETLSFASPLGIIGKAVDALVMENYLRKFLTDRNEIIKEFAESGKWKDVL
jgi:ligand-binding SRPBCC domain-containing protein